jgi:hypothetical protein
MGLTTTSTVPPRRDPLCIGSQALRAWLRSTCPSGTKPFSHRKAIPLSWRLWGCNPGYAPGSSGRNGASKLSAFWIILRPEGTGGFLSALHFGDFQRRKPEIHCADDAVHLFRIACADNRTSHRRMAQRPGDGGFTRRTAMPVAHRSQPFD